MNKIDPGSQKKLTLGGYIAENPPIIVWYAIAVAWIVTVGATRQEFDSDTVWRVLIVSGIISLIIISVKVFFDIRKKNSLYI